MATILGIPIQIATLERELNHSEPTHAINGGAWVLRNGMGARAATSVLRMTRQCSPPQSSAPNSSDMSISALLLAIQGLKLTYGGAVGDVPFANHSRSSENAATLNASAR